MWALAALAAVVTLNYVVVRIGIRAIVAGTMLSLVPFLIVVFSVIVHGGIGGNTLSVFDPGQTSWNAVFHGILFAVSLFIGFETVAALGEEARLPRRSIPVAMITSIGLCAVFYLLVSYAGAIGFGRAGARTTWFASGNPFGVLGERYAAHPLKWIINLTIVLDLFSVCVAFTLAASRILMTLARDGLLPAAADTPEHMREWVEETLKRTHGLLIARLRPVLGSLDDKELAVRVFCVGGIVNRFSTAPYLPESAAVSSPEVERLLVAAITGLLSGPGSVSTRAPIAGSRASS